jgi:hypothetical protein
MHVVWLAALSLAAAMTYAAGSAAQASGQPATSVFAGVLDEHPAIRYADRASSDPVARLAAAIASGSAALASEPPAGYLRSVLRALDISPESQLLVFSKTGLQREHTSPQTPRALYFNDTVVVGYIPGARHIEIAAHDATQGVIFYTIDQMDTSSAVVTPRTNCLTCHVSGSTLDVPGLIARSNYTNDRGELIPQLGFHIVNHRTPLSQRWGGWFVTGKYDLAPYGGVTHLGNVATAMHPARDDAAGTSNEILHRWLASDLTTAGYPSHESDIAALMVFDHQVGAINLLTRYNWEARVAAYNGGTDFRHGELRRLSEEVASYLLFVDEVPPPARLTPRPGFAAQFVAKGPRDVRGRSLRELDLNTRLLKHGASHMIHSAAFDALPETARQAVYTRMRALLRDGSPLARRLTRVERRTIDEIMRDTKSDWR